MDRCEIVEQVKGLQTIDDLVALLNQIKSEEFHMVSHPVTAHQLFYYSNPKHGENRYQTFQIRKKSGGMREICAPSYKLAILLRVINFMFKSVYVPSESTMGFAEGRSVVSNASFHAGHNYVFNIDLENFFPSIPQGRVWKRLQLPPFNFTADIASILAGICCYPDEKTGKNVLPQGAPTSPLLSNAICDKLDRRMRGVAKRFGLHYTRYADDMSFSSMHNVYQEGSEFRKEVKRIVEVEGFVMNDKKTRLLRTKERQEVTGLTVNNKANVTRKYLHDLRRYIYVWERDGYGKAYAFFYRHYKQEKGYIKKGEPIMENVIGGKLNYLRMVKGQNNAAYQKLQKRFDALQQIVYIDTETDKTDKYIYVQPYSLSDFEDLFHTQITLDVTKRKKLVGRCTIDGIAKEISISLSTQEFLREQLERISIGDISSQDFFREFYVTLCRKKGKNRWLITKNSLKRSSCLSLQDARVDIDVLLDVWEKSGIDEAAKLLDQNVYGKDGVGQYMILKPIEISSSEPSVPDAAGKSDSSLPSDKDDILDLFEKNPDFFDQLEETIKKYGI